MTIAEKTIYPTASDPTAVSAVLDFFRIAPIALIFFEYLKIRTNLNTVNAFAKSEYAKSEIYGQTSPNMARKSITEINLKGKRTKDFQ